VVIWKHLSHPNVLLFIGAAMVISSGEEVPGKYEIVSEFMENQTIVAFIKRNKDADRLELVGFDSPHWSC
jgi:hypothetical protein